MAYYLSEINARCRADAAGFIAECDRVYADRLELAADRIMENMEKSPIVLLSGPSGSGKTTTALKICEVLERRGVRTHSISMDNYFKSVSPETTPRTPEGKYDLESPLCMDMELLNEHFSVLSEGGRILVPRYDFVHQCRDLEPSASLRLKKNEVAVFEGIHALNDSITLVHPERSSSISARAATFWTRNGAVVFKGTWNAPYAPHRARLSFPRHRRAGDACALGQHPPRREAVYLALQGQGESPVRLVVRLRGAVLNNTATGLFNAMPSDTPRYSELQSILPAFERFEDVSPELLAKDSLLREFIGGGKYSY